jgi:hypothetical protein
MISPQRKTVYLSFISTDLPVWNIIEATASLYQKDRDRFHLLLSQQNLPQPGFNSIDPKIQDSEQSLLWLEISPSQVIMTVQGQNRLNYRHFWERGVYGYSRYWLNGTPSEQIHSLRLRNYTRHLRLEGNLLPQTLQVEYELWSGQIELGAYFWHLNIHH